ncbi:unnamed protein product [Allacma fusca]|uniref:Uncharacterized protein n=1 Tax=Allacma fusca TaxID=39272 RepID=A0A8J2JW65_9HEXA|nr:unnamed protein product [Allacma fusca]
MLDLTSENGYKKKELYPKRNHHHFEMNETSPVIRISCVAIVYRVAGTETSHYGRLHPGLIPWNGESTRHALFNTHRYYNLKSC